MFELTSSSLAHQITLDPEPTFLTWRAHHRAKGRLPIIGVTGSRGKTTVVQLLASIFTEAGIRFAARTDSSVEIRGRRQRGEITPWLNAKAELERGTLDIAVEELDWVTVQSMGARPESYPAFVVTNICGNRDACLIQGDARRAVAALPKVFDATAPDGELILTGDEIIVSIEESAHARPTTFVGLNRDSPGLRSHLDAGQAAAWIEQHNLVVGRREDNYVVCGASELEFALGGRAGFQLTNALMAAATAFSIGLSTEQIRRGLAAFRVDPKRTPNAISFSNLDGVTVAIDRPNPSWFLRPVLRALRDVEPARIITVVGKLSSVPAADLREVGRLIGRSASFVVVHSQDDLPETADAIRHGAAMNDVPPVLIHARSESRAVSRALTMARKGDLVFVLSEHPESLARLLSRSVWPFRRRTHQSCSPSGVPPGRDA